MTWEAYKVTIREVMREVRMMKAFLFDFDLTLVDSREGIWNTLCQLAVRHGLRRPLREETDPTIGIPLGDAMVCLWGEVKEQWLVDYRQLFVQFGYKGCRMFSGVKQALTALERQGYSLAVATNRIDPLGVVCASGVEPLVHRIYGTAKLPHKPEPGMLLQCCADFGIEPQQAYYVGDTELDMMAAVRAGCVPIGVTTGGRTAQFLRQHGAYDVIDSVADLPQWLEEQQ